MVLKVSNPKLMHRNVPDGVDISAEYMTDDDFLNVDSPMLTFYRGKTIFITGATGFLGQLYVEKLLRIGVKFIYILIRSKNGKTVDERLIELCTSPVFVKLERQDPGFRNKIKLVVGDLASENLGISPNHEIELMNKIEIVIHSAALTKPNLTLMELVQVNVRGTNEVLRLCERMFKIKIFVFISSSFSQYPRTHVEETFYPSPMDPYKLIRLVESMERNQCEQIHFLNLTKKIISPWPDAQSYTKAVCESLVFMYKDKMFIRVIRPSHIISTSEDPIPGWSRDLFGLNGLLAGVSFGFVRCICFGKNDQIDVVCADFVTNSTLAIIWDGCKTSAFSNVIPRPKIFHITNSAQNPIKLDLLIKSLEHIGQTVPIVKSFWHPFTYVARYSFEYKLISILFHFIPSLCIDMGLKLQGKIKFRMLPHCRLLQDFIDSMNLSGCAKITFDNYNALTIYDRMTEYDKRIFPCDMRNIFWKQYIYEYVLGAKIYLFKESYESIERAEKKHRRRTVLHYVVMVLFYGILLYSLLMFLESSVMLKK